MIGDHVVTLTPDPDVLAWGPELASNGDFTSNITEWSSPPFGSTWTWVAGSAVGAVKPSGQDQSWTLTRRVAYPIPRDASFTYRVRTKVTVSKKCTVVLSLFLGLTPEAANGGNFWFSGQCRELQTWFNVPAGTHQLETTFDVSTVPSEYAYLAPRVNPWQGSDTVAPPSPPTVDYLHLQGQGADATDITCLVDDVDIHHGREDTDSQPEAASCTLNLSAITGVDDFPDALEVGGIIRVTTTTPTVSSTRFLGRITDMELAWDDAGEDTPNSLVCKVIAVSMLADLGRRIVGDTPFPQELDGARVARVLSLAGVTLDPSFSDPGTVQILPRDVDSQPALEVAQATAASGSGVVWHTRSGEVRYADAMHRRNVPESLELDACDLLVTPAWRRTTEGLLNLVSIGYGPTPDEGEQPRYVASHPQSVERYGRYELSTATELVALADATALGQLLVTRNASPVWVFDDLPLDMKGLSPEQTVAVLSLDMHALIRVVGLPYAGAAPTSAVLWVEGWSERLAWGEHELTLTVSGYCRTSPAPWWDDVDPTWTWDTVPAITWDDATCLGPPVVTDTWDSQPASLRWDMVSAAETWDTYG